jgi:hypothetical protein
MVNKMNKPEFVSHKLNGDGISKAQSITSLFSSLLIDLESICMEGREFSITKTKLEEACFFAKKAMAISLENQEQ